MSIQAAARQNIFDPIEAITSGNVDATTIDELANSLQDYVDESEADEYEIVDADIPIVSRDQAEYYARSYKAAQKENEACEAVAKAKIRQYTEKVEAWLESVTKSNTNAMERWSMLLRQYANEQLKDSKSRSLKLIEGTLSFRKQQPKYEYDDDELRKLLPDVAPDFLKPQPPKVDHAGLKKAGSIDENNAFCLNGKVLSGVTITMQEDSFEVK